MFLYFVPVVLYASSVERCVISCL